MPDLPEYMWQKERDVDPNFQSEERLFRRVPPTGWDDDEVSLDSIEFPDMSTTREKHGPAAAARWDRGKYVDWGVIGFRVGDIPAEIPFQGAFYYRMRAVHSPLKRNYPHSEVKVYEAPWDSPGTETHIGLSEMNGIPLAARQEWRELLRRQCRIVLRPGQEPDEAE